MKILKGVLSIFVGSLIGLGLFYLHVEYTYENLGTNNGYWTTSTTEEDQESQMAVNAIAIHSIFRLNKDQAIYFNTLRDSDGNKLDYRNHYRVIGNPLPTRFWSLTFYGSDDYLMPNGHKKYSISSQNVIYEADGSFVIDVSPEIIPGAKNWVPSAPSQDGGTGVHPYLRLYDPSLEIRTNLSTFPLPTIVKIEDGVTS